MIELHRNGSRGEVIEVGIKGRSYRVTAFPSIAEDHRPMAEVFVVESGFAYKHRTTGYSEMRVRNGHWRRLVHDTPAYIRAVREAKREDNLRKCERNQPTEE